MTKKKKKKRPQKGPKMQPIVPPKMKQKWRYKDALITTLFTLGGIYASFLTLILIKDSDAMGNLFQAQSLLGGLYVNLFAVVGVAYSKFAKEMLVHRNVYWLSLASFLTIISIYAQACVMTDTSTSLVVSWIESPYASVALQILLAILIFVIAAQKELDVRISYNKKKLNR